MYRVYEAILTRDLFVGLLYHHYSIHLKPAILQSSVDRSSRFSTAPQYLTHDMMKFVNLRLPSTQSKPSFAWNCRLLNMRVMRVGSVEACRNFTSSLIPFFLGKSLYCEDCYEILLNLEMSSFGQIQRMNCGMLPTQLAETGAKPANYPWKES